MLKKSMLITLIMTCITAVTIMGVFFYKSVAPHNVVLALEEGVTNLVVGDETIDLEENIVVEEDRILLPIQVVKRYIHPNLEFSKEYGRLYLHFEKPTFKLETEALDERLKEGLHLNVLAEKRNDTHYINILDFRKLLGVEVTYVKATNIVVIDPMERAFERGEIKRTTYLRPKKSSFSFKMDKLKKEDTVVILEEEGKWLRVRTEEGYIGYVLERQVKDLKENLTDEDVDRRLNVARASWEPTGKINLVWNHVNKVSPDLSEEETIEGLDVVSPTWFSIVSDNGYVINNSDFDYVKDAHEKGYKVWALIDNSFDKDLTHKILTSDAAQKNIINQMVLYASLYNLDGINIDFENVYYEDRDALTAFVQRFTAALKEQNLIVSMDMTIPSGSLTWSKFYDREKLGAIVDYCMVMTYDEHWSSSPKSGSVASINWVKRGIERTLEYIPKEKLLMGIPFYTREWEETKDEKGRTKVKSKALSMKAVQERIDTYQTSVVWLEEIGQHYTEYTKDDKRYRIWIEDPASIELKANLAWEYDLAGVASWRKGFEVEDVWTVLNDVIKSEEVVWREK